MSRGYWSQWNECELMSMHGVEQDDNHYDRSDDYRDAYQDDKEEEEE